MTRFVTSRDQRNFNQHGFSVYEYNAVFVCVFVCVCVHV